MKTCRRCKRELSLNEFTKDKSRKDQKKVYCRECCAEMYLALDKDHRRKLTRALYQQNKEEELKRLRQYRKDCPGRLWATKLRSRFNIDASVYFKMLAQQVGTCASCGSEDPQTSSGVWSIDHDHSCCPGVKSCGECIRGLLCVNCNFAAGYLKDSPERCRQLASYLEQGNLASTS